MVLARPTQVKGSMEDFVSRRNGSTESGGTISSPRPPFAIKRKPAPLPHSKTRHVEVLSSDCGCTLPRNIKSQGKLGNLGKIWPLFRNFPADFPAGGERRRHAPRDRTISVAAGGLRSVSPNKISRRSSSRRSSDSPRFAIDKRPPASTGQSEIPGDATTPRSVASDHASTSNEGLQRIGDIFDTELETRSKRLDAELLDSSYVQWEELSSALEREFEMLGYPCHRRRIPTHNSTKFSSIDSEDWAVRTVKEDLHGPSKNGTPSNTSSISTSSAQSRRIFDHPADKCDPSLRDRVHGATIVQNKLNLKAEVGLNFVSISQFGEVVEKASASLNEFCSILLKANRGTMKKSTYKSSVDEKEIIGWMMVRPLLPHATFAQPQHVKFGIQACINEAVFCHFQTEAYGMGSSLINYRATQDSNASRSRLRQVAFLKEFYACEALSPEELMDPESADFNENFQLFCRKKLKAVQKSIGWLGRWPSKLCEAFLESMKRVWMAHKLAFALENPAIMFYVNEQAEWDGEFMEALEYEGEREIEERRLFYEFVQFMVLPGFLFREEGVVKSKVYLKPREGISVMGAEEGGD